MRKDEFEAFLKFLTLNTLRKHLFMIYAGLFKSVHRNSWDIPVLESLETALYELLPINLPTAIYIQLIE